MSEPVPFNVIIPARLAATRLPRKLLAEVAGRPAMFHTWDSARKSGAGRVVIAACGSEIADIAEGFGAEICLTDPALPSGTDRCLAALDQLDLPDSAIVVNLQADELLMPPDCIGAVAALLHRSGADIATLAQPLAAEEIQLPQRVKVVLNQQGRALYFSRAPVPWDGGSNRPFAGALHHLGIYAYSAASLRRFAALPPSPLEKIERLEQLRALEAGMSVAVECLDHRLPAGLDTPEDLERLRLALNQSGAGRS